MVRWSVDSDHHEYDGSRNAFPVDNLDLKDTVSPGGRSFMDRMRSVIASAYLEHEYLSIQD